MRPSRRRIAAVAALAALGGGGLAIGQAGPRAVQLRSRKFVFNPAVIQMKVGETIALELIAEDVTMGVSFPDFGVRGDLVPGKPQTLTLTAGKAGTFDFNCDVFCGDDHEDMGGKLVVS